MNKIPFGNPDRMSLVKCPAMGVGLGVSKWSSRGTFLNGAQYVQQSAGHSVSRDLSWRNLTNEEYFTIMSHLTSDEPIIFFDMLVNKGNALSQVFASPKPYGRSPVRNGTSTPHPSVSGTMAISYVPDSQRTQYLVVPDGHELRLRFNGQAADGANNTTFRIQRYGVTPEWEVIPWNTVRTYTGSGVYAIQLRGNSTTTTAAILRGGYAQVVPVGSPVTSTPSSWPGLGAYQYKVDPSTISSSFENIPHNMNSLSVTLVESD